jgi:carbonic anhydrase/acetyltransferase-like protein (isoleucine patch superfamily)
MPIYSLDGVQPEIAEGSSTWIAPDAHVMGKVRLGQDSTVWFGAVIRGDNDSITIGVGTNVQDGAVLHADPGFPLLIGDNVTVGHRAIVHGCTIGSGSLIGMGATLLNGVEIGRNCLVGANALLTEGKSFPDGSLIVGAPAKAIRTLSPEQVAQIRQVAEHYVQNGRRFAAGLVKIG